jgi:hypothetical protein
MDESVKKSAVTGIHIPRRGKRQTAHMFVFFMNKDLDNRHAIVYRFYVAGQFQMKRLIQEEKNDL